MELEAGEVVLSPAAQAHAARRHPVEYSRLLPHLDDIIADPLYIGDDHNNPGIELVGRVHSLGTLALVAVIVERDDKGRYHVVSFYPISDEKAQGRRQKGFLKIPKK